MFLYSPAGRGSAAAFSKNFLHLLWDLGYVVGHSVRTASEALGQADADSSARNAFMDPRFLVGSRPLFDGFLASFHRLLERRRERYIEENIALRASDFGKYGASIYMLEPNIKKSGGGLRDIHYLRWICRLRYRTYHLGELHNRQGILSNSDYITLSSAMDFLLRIRNELHFGAGKAEDVLTFDDQVRLARFFGFEDADGLLGVERFMQQYYQYTTLIHEISSRLVERARRRSLRRRFSDRFFKKVVGPFLVRAGSIEFLPGGEEDPWQLLSIFLAAQEEGVELSDDALERIGRRLQSVDETFFDGEQTAPLFLRLLSRPGRIAALLRQMHRVRLLWRVVPVFARIHRLVQFNQYHKYTIDEHCLFAVEEAERLSAGSGDLSRIYGSIKKKEILHLALLLHDSGKGRGGDHNEWGAKVAEETAARLGLSAEDRDLLVFLVRYHLTMSHIAFRRDLSDEKVLLRFSRMAANPEALNMLAVLTYADIRAVGPETWNAWKEELLLDLYDKSMEILAGERPILSGKERASTILGQLKQALSDWPEAEVEAAFEQVSERYLFSTATLKIAQQMRAARGLSDVKVEADFDPATSVTEYTFYLPTDAPGLFYKLAGLLSAKGYSIMGAQVHTRKNGVVVDAFQVIDSVNGAYHRPRPWEMERSLKQILSGEASVDELFAKRPILFSRPRQAAMIESTKVEIDNDTSEGFTILDIFAEDRPGLLYVITRALFDLGLSIHSSKIATRLDQIVDVFYVTDFAGRKVTESERVLAIRAHLASRIDLFTDVAKVG